jgi:hypothetical protein
MDMHQREEKKEYPSTTGWEPVNLWFIITNKKLVYFNLILWGENYIVQFNFGRKSTIISHIVLISALHNQFHNMIWEKLAKESEQFGYQ